MKNEKLMNSHIHSFMNMVKVHMAVSYTHLDFFDFEGLIFKTGKRVTLEKHSPIKQFNEPADKFYYVRSGLVRAVVLHSDGNEKRCV